MTTPIRAAVVTIGLMAAAFACPVDPFDHPPKLINTLEPFRKAVREAGYEGNVVVTLTVTMSGTVEKPRISPVSLHTQALLELVKAWRFCPAIQLGKIAESGVKFEIQIRKL